MIIFFKEPRLRHPLCLRHIIHIHEQTGTFRFFSGRGSFLRLRIGADICHLRLILFQLSRLLLFSFLLFLPAALFPTSSGRFLMTSKRGAHRLFCRPHPHRHGTMDNQCARHQKQGDHNDLRSRLIKEKREQRRQCGTEQTAPLCDLPAEDQSGILQILVQQRTAAQLFIRRDRS